MQLQGRVGEYRCAVCGVIAAARVLLRSASTPQSGVAMSHRRGSAFPPGARSEAEVTGVAGLVGPCSIGMGLFGGNG